MAPKEGQFCSSSKDMLACRDAARSQRLLAANVVRQLIRMNERYCRRALAAWQSAMQAQRAKRAMLHGAIQRMALAKLRAAWQAWTELVSMKLAVRHYHSAVITKVPSAHLPLKKSFILRPCLGIEADLAFTSWY